MENHVTTTLNVHDACTSYTSSAIRVHNACTVPIILKSQKNGRAIILTGNN